MLKGVFLPTPSHGGRHFNTVYIGSLSNFYPRPHMEGDNIVCFPFPYACLFLPTPSHGGRPCCKACMYNVSRISTHALTWRATMVKNIRQQYLSNFYPRPHMEGDQRERKSAIIKTGDFYPRPHMEGDSKHAEVQACISAAYLKCSTRKEPRGEGMCDRGSHRQSGRRKGLKTHSSKMSSWLH